MSRNLYDSANDTLTPIGGYQSVDDTLSATSQNPVKNRAVKAALDKKFGYEDSSENSISSNDYIPFYDTSEGTNKKIEVSKLNLGGGGSTITVTTPSEELFGQTVTLSKGSTTLSSSFDSQGTAVFTGVMLTGTLTIECEGYATTVSVEYFGNYEVELTAGFSWTTWVDTASQLDSSDYADLSEVLADEEAIRELFTEHACVDYMAEATSSNADLETIINDDYCAKWINNSDYALDFLGANTVIKALMDEADKYGYGEWVITDDTTTPPTWGPKGNVTVMTANNAPYGEASASSQYNTTFAPWMAFNGTNIGADDCWHSASGVSQWIQYKFTNPIKVKRISIRDRNGSVPSSNYSVIVQGSNDGTTFENIQTISYLPITSGEHTFDIDNDNYYLIYRLAYTTPSDNPYAVISNLQFYGRELKASVPTMTSNTAPYGEAFASSVANSNVPAWKAFDKTNGIIDCWASSGQVPQFIGYTFTSPKVVTLIEYIPRVTDGNVLQQAASLADFKLQGSNDGFVNDINTIASYEVRTAYTDNYKPYYFDATNVTPYSSYRLYIEKVDPTNPNTNATIAIGGLNFYGLDYSEKEFEEGTTKKWLYDHGVELETLTITGTGTKNDDCIQLTATNSQASVTIDTTDYSLMRGKVGAHASGTNQLLCGSGSSNFTASNMPYNNGFDVSSINGSNAVGVKQTANGVFDATEIWLE